MIGPSEQYDRTAAEQFREAGVLVCRAGAELPTFVGLAGDLTGKTVLDLACGAGRFTRIVLDAGASRVVGVDASADMLDQAHAELGDDPRVELLHHDVVTMPSLGTFDVVVAGFLLNYATDHDQLADMCRQIARHLADGGLFIGSIPDSDFDRHRPMDTRYGVTYDLPHDMSDGEAYDFRLYQAGPPLLLRAFFWHNATIVDALTRAGLRDVTVHPWQPGEDAVTRLGRAFWEDWIANPMCAALTARR